MMSDKNSYVQEELFLCPSGLSCLLLQAALPCVPGSIYYYKLHCPESLAVFTITDIAALGP